MRFWDSSALVPLVVEEASSGTMAALWKQDAECLVWWGTPVEIASALARRQREAALPEAMVRAALQRLDAFSECWHEVQPVEAVRREARRLLRVHPLRAPDALQLAAAVTAVRHLGGPAELPFVCLDRRLAEAAAKEGFPLEPATVP